MTNEYGKTKSKSSKTKTTSTRRSRSGLNSTEICEIIKQCGDSGVRSFSYRDLSFHLDADIPLTQPVQVYDNNIDAPTTKEKLDISLDDGKLTEHEVEDLMISDPEAYEKMMQGEN